MLGQQLVFARGTVTQFLMGYTSGCFENFFRREENPDDPDVVRKTAFGQRYTWYIPDYQFRKRNGQQVRQWSDRLS